MRTHPRCGAAHHLPPSRRRQLLVAYGGDEAARAGDIAGEHASVDCEHEHSHALGPSMLVEQSFADAQCFAFSLLGCVDVDTPPPTDGLSLNIDGDVHAD